MITTFNHPKMQVTLRTVCAVVGGYFAAMALSLLIAIPMEMAAREQEVFIRMMFFTIYSVLIITAFSINRQRTVYIATFALNALAWLALTAVQGATS